MLGRIYMIYCTLDESICYVGSTITTINQRFGIHKEFYNAWLYKGGGKCAIYTYFQALGIDNFKIKLIKEYNVVDTKHLRAYEQLWISKTKCVNINSAFRIKHLSLTEYYEKNRDRLKELRRKRYEENKDKYRDKQKRYYEENIDKIKKYSIRYYEENKDKMKEYRANYREENRDKIKELSKKHYEKNKDKYRDKYKKYCEENKEKMKEYYKKNKDKFKDRSRQYYEENKDKWKEYYNEKESKVKEYAKKYHIKNQNKFTCDLCNFSASQKGNYTRHLESKKHALIIATGSP